MWYTWTDLILLISPFVGLVFLILWDTRNPTPEKRFSFLKRHDGFDVVNLAVLVFTFVAAAVAAYQAGRLADLTDDLVKDGQASSKQQAEFTRESNRLNREALIASSRAWVGPVEAKIVGAVEQAKAVKVSISIRNTGREPARNFRWVPGHFVAPDNSALVQEVETSLKFCFGTPTAPSGQTVFPSSGFGSGADFSIEFPKEAIDEEVISGTKILVAHGCLAYESFGSVRHSAFCYFYKSGISSTEHLNICDAGSGAD